MKHLITIESKTTESSDFDSVPELWETFTKAWFRVKPLRGEEMLQAQQVNEKVTHKLTTRPWISGVTNEMRADLNGRKLNVVSSINVDERNKELELMCVEVS